MLIVVAGIPLLIGLAWNSVSEERSPSAVWRSHGARGLIVTGIAILFWAAVLAGIGYAVVRLIR